MRIVNRTFFLIIIITALIITFVVAANRLNKPQKNYSAPIHFSTVKPHLPIVQISKQADFRDAVVLNNSEIWAIGFEGTYVPHIWHSTDGGYTWEVKPTPNPDLLLDTIDFTDQQHGWAAGVYNILTHTNDGGKTWRQFKAPTSAEIKAVHFVDHNIGYIAGGTGFMNRKTQELTLGLEILCTKDGGRDWRTCYKDNTSSEVIEFATLGENITVAAVDGNSLLRTDNGGVTWQVVASQNRGFRSVKFTSNGIGWAVGHSGFYRSEDQGKTWQKLDKLPIEIAGHRWESIDFNNAQKGMAVGERGAMAITNDGGLTWSERENGIEEDLGKVRLGVDTGIVIGSKKVYVIKLDSPDIKY